MIMNKKIIIPIVLLTLISLAVFVSATRNIVEREDSGSYVFEVEIKEGWNIIAGTMPDDNSISLDSEIKESDIKAMWYYSPKFKEYIQVYPTPNYDKLRQAEDDDLILTSAMWIYSKKSGTLKYSTLGDYPLLESRQLYSGWNFVTITEDMVNGFEGSCNMEKAYFWDISNKEWMIFPYSNPRDFTWDGDTIFGYGLVIKVSEDCNLALSSGSTTSPPTLPGGIDDSNNIICEDSDGGIDYDKKGTTTGLERYTKKLVTEEDRCDYFVTPEGEEVFGLFEFHCNDPDSSFNYTQVKTELINCPNGCNDGVCIQ